ncbi:hypothetical protein O6P43_020035 [Quillaja saponaria]|uniref:Uncharacterized protein n=1 Tax=Quillaja saponaria TaxID=32244 RepID=A0AAD7LJV1_QUISA|nr:hypothetical protein O6P43_020035 [Quillaja saponaria]
MTLRIGKAQKWWKRTSTKHKRLPRHKTLGILYQMLWIWLLLISSPLAMVAVELSSISIFSCTNAMVFPSCWNHLAFQLVMTSDNSCLLDSIWHCQFVGDNLEVKVVVMK